MDVLRDGVAPVLSADRDPLIDPADLHRFKALAPVRRDDPARLGNDFVASSRLRGLSGFGSAAASAIEGSAAPSDIPVRSEVMKVVGPRVTPVAVAVTTLNARP